MPNCFFFLQCFQTLLTCQTWYGYICNCQSVGLFWPELGDGNTPRAVFDTSVNLITIKQGREKATLTQHEIYNSVPQPAVPSELTVQAWRATHRSTIVLFWGELIGSENVHKNQYGYSWRLLPFKVDETSPLPCPLVRCRSRSGQCSINLATAPTAWPLLLYLITQTWPGLRHAALTLH